MLHISQEMYFFAQEIGRLMAKTEEFEALKQAEEASKNDAALSACVAEYIEKRRALEAETMKDEKNFDQIGALTRELDEISERMGKIPAYQALQKANADFEALKDALTNAAQAGMYPELSGCSGDCAHCSGCGD